MYTELEQASLNISEVIKLQCDAFFGRSILPANDLTSPRVDLLKKGDHH